MPVTVADLVATPALDLRLLVPGAPIDQPLSWVHVSELPDPAPFLEGGELLLSTGRALRDGEPAGPYVQRLVEKGVAGLGFGTGVGDAEVPRALVAAAGEAGLALLEVPRATPFIAISRMVSAALAADEYAAVARSATALQDLTRAALAPGAPAGVLARLAREIGGWVLLLDSVGDPLEAVPASAARRARALRPELDRLRGLRAAAALSGPEETVLLQSLGSGARTRAFLAVGRPGPLPPADRYVVNAAALLLTLRMEQSRGVDDAMSALRAGLLRLLLARAEPTVADVLDELGQPLPREPLHVLTVVGSAEQRAAAVDVAAEAAAHARAALFTAGHADALVLLVAADGPLPARLADLPNRVPGAAVGSSGATRWADLPEAVRRARQAAEHGRARNAGVVAFDDLAAPGLTALLDPDATRAFADALLASLHAADRGTDLLDSLRAWLTHHGQWEAAAAQLGVHRHTLRKRMARVAALLDRDLDAFGVRAELWIALHPPENRAQP